MSRVDQLKRLIRIARIAQANLGYVGIVLDDPSKAAILHKAEVMLAQAKGVTQEELQNLALKPIAHHMTLTLGKLPEGFEYLEGQKATIKATEFGFSDKAVAFKCSDTISLGDDKTLSWKDFPKSKNFASRFPHVTVYTLGTGRPVESKDITEFEELNNPVTLTGIIRQ